MEIGLLGDGLIKSSLPILTYAEVPFVRLRRKAIMRGRSLNFRSWLRLLINPVENRIPT